jgi:hypothetical protein
MSAKEKAKKLFLKFYRDNDLLVEDLSKIQAKECALIAVDEILDVWENQQPRRFEEWLGIFQYWQEVKQEIEKL